MRISDWSSDVCSSDLFWKWLLACLPVGLVLALLATLSDYGRLGRFGDATAPWRHALDQGIVLLVALGYAALFVFLFSRARWHRWLRHLAPVGRMALSNYLEIGRAHV